MTMIKSKHTTHSCSGRVLFAYFGILRSGFDADEHRFAHDCVHTWPAFNVYELRRSVIIVKWPGMFGAPSGRTGATSAASSSSRASTMFRRVRAAPDALRCIAREKTRAATGRRGDAPW